MDQKSSGIFSFYLENDLFAGTDRGYTQGIKFVWVSPEFRSDPQNVRSAGWLDAVSRKLSFFQAKDSQRFYSIFIGQNIYTPNDIERRDLIVDDRPYAGLTYFGIGFHSKSSRSMDTLEFQGGVVGPHSYAGDIQKTWHKFFGWQLPNGWDNQLKDEPVLGIVFDHKEKIFEAGKAGGPGYDVIAHAGAALSNVITGASGGLEIRAGWNLPKDFGTSLIQPGSDSSALFEEQDARRSGRSLIGFHVFLALEGHAALRDIFLDGNTFRESHRVEKIPWTADLVAGLAFRFKRLKISYSYVYQTKQFKSQKYKEIYGSLNISFSLKK